MFFPSHSILQPLPKTLNFLQYLPTSNPLISSHSIIFN